MHFRDRGCVRTLRPLFVYATVNKQIIGCILLNGSVVSAARSTDSVLDFALIDSENQ